ncbi:MAG: DUF835 domain-containing protein [Thaumarchaeota archaeon]|nr:DUF835 domain-containing protein [Nitrososphaerota archaeon]
MLITFDPERGVRIIAVVVTAVWAYFAVRLISLGKGVLERPWKNMAYGAISIAFGVFFELTSYLFGIDWLDDIGIGLIAMGGLFVAWAMRRQYVVWNSVASSADSAKILESFATLKSKPTRSSEMPVSNPNASNARLKGLGGKRIVLEFDPASDYERYVESLIEESTSGGSQTVLFTKPGSTLSGLRPSKLVYLSVSEQSLKLSPEGVLSVSITNPSLILDAFKSVLASNPDAAMIIDNLTELTLNLGFEKTYSLLQQVSEKMTKSKSPLVLLLNPAAHDEKIIAAFEGYGNVIIQCDSEGTHSRKGGEMLTYA